MYNVDEDCNVENNQNAIWSSFSFGHINLFDFRGLKIALDTHFWTDNAIPFYV